MILAIFALSVIAVAALLVLLALWFSRAAAARMAGGGGLRHEKLRISMTVVVVGFVLAISCCRLSYFPPYLFHPSARFTDFTGVVRHWNQYLTYNLAASAPDAVCREGVLVCAQKGYPSPLRDYPPFAYAIANALRLVPVKLAYAGFATLFFGVFMWLCLRAVRPAAMGFPDLVLRRGGKWFSGLRRFMATPGFETALALLVFTFLAYPAVFLMDRGNFEGFVFIFLALFLFFYRKDKPFLYVPCLAAAIATKIVPAVFLVLLLADRKYREAFAVFVVTFVLDYVPLLFFRYTVADNILRMVHNMNLFTVYYGVYDYGLDFGHSLFGMLKIFLRIFGDGNVPPWLGPYMAGALLCFAALSAYIIWREKSLWKRVALLVFAMNMLPYVSSDYKLVHIFLPFWLYLSEEDGPACARFAPAYSLMFGLLVAPQMRWLPLIENGVILFPLLMAAFSFLIIADGWLQSENPNLRSR